MMERILNKTTFNRGDRFIIYYGFGVNDIFMTEKKVETDIEGALNAILKQKGFDRIVYISPHKKIYYQDDESRKNAAVIPSTHQLPFDFMDEMGGPLDNRFLLKINDASTAQNLTDIGDQHTIRMLDAMMRDQEKFHSAIIFMQAETILHYFEDQRTLAGLIGEWLRLPSVNHNICIMVFSAENSEDLSDICQRIEIPELRNMFSRKRTQYAYQLVPISGPDPAEILRLIYAAKPGSHLLGEEAEKMAKMIYNENQTARFWKKKLTEIPSVSIKNAKQQGWFSADINLDTPAEERLMTLIGLAEIKNRILELRDWATVVYKNKKGSTKSESPLLHMIFSGNPGTGKTTVARLLGEMYHDIGILQRGHLVECNASDLVADYVGGTAIKTNSVVDSALGGVLFIDEAYALTQPDRGGFGSEALDILVTRMENDRDNLLVIAAGYPDKMRSFRRANPGLSRRFPEENFITFTDYSAEEMWQIFNQMTSKRQLTLSDTAITTLVRIIEEMSNQRDQYFGNAGEIRNLIDSMERKRAVRIVKNHLKMDTPLDTEDISELYLTYLPGNISRLEDLLAELSELIGLREVKQSIRKFLQLRQYEILDKRNHSLYKMSKIPHLLFYGNPGTGKTTIARLLGKIFQSMGLLRKGHLVEVSRADLVAGYVGQTALKTREKIESALDGILFIDEAYALTRDGTGEYGQEVVDTLVKAMEDYTGRLVIIAAGYEEEMFTFISSNPGLISRFDAPFHFGDYGQSELIEVFELFAAKENFHLTDEIIEVIGKRLMDEKKVSQRYFGNARSARRLFEQMKRNFASRLMEMDDDQRNKILEDNKAKKYFEMADVPPTVLTSLLPAQTPF